MDADIALRSAMGRQLEAQRQSVAGCLQRRNPYVDVFARIDRGTGSNQLITQLSKNVCASILRLRQCSLCSKPQTVRTLVTLAGKTDKLRQPSIVSTLFPLAVQERRPRPGMLRLLLYYRLVPTPRGG
ncbi:hypothetical protein ACFRMO_38570, partial [Streptomyces anulatus]